MLPRRRPTLRVGDIRSARLKEDIQVKLPNSVKARVFRSAITISSLVALAIAAGAGRKFS